MEGPPGLLKSEHKPPTVLPGGSQVVSCTAAAGAVCRAARCAPLCSLYPLVIIINFLRLDKLRFFSLTYVKQHQDCYLSLSLKAKSTGDILSYLYNIWSISLRDFRESCVLALDVLQYQKILTV